MRWQDVVIAAAQTGFVFAMLPTIFSKDKPALATCVMNVVLVFAIVFSLFTLGLWLSVLTGTAVGITWGILAVQKYNLDKKKKRRARA